MPVITLPDGSQRNFDHPVTVAEVAASIGAGLAKAALAGKVGSKLVDTSFSLIDDARLEIVTDKHPDALEIIRHSTAHSTCRHRGLRARMGLSAHGTGAQDESGHGTPYG